MVAFWAYEICITFAITLYKTQNNLNLEKKWKFGDEKWKFGVSEWRKMKIRSFEIEGE